MEPTVIQVAVMYVEDQDTSVVIESMLNLGANGFTHLVHEDGKYVIVSKDVLGEMLDGGDIHTICRVEAEQEYGTDGVFRFHTGDLWVEVVQ